MPQEIHCPNCGARTPITSLFCVECGKKVEFSKLKPEHLQEPDRRAIELVGKLVRLLLSILVFGGAALALWPKPLEGEVGGEVQARECRMKVVRLHDAAQNGISIPIVFSEEEINAYLQGIVQQTREGQTGRTPANLESVRVSLTEAEVIVHTAIRLQVLRITYRLQGPVDVGDAGAVFDVRRAQLGHLPMPGPLRGWVAGRVAAILGGLDAERTILRQTERIQLRDQRIRITTRQG